MKGLVLIMARFCEKCGTQLDGVEAFCPNCGAPVAAGPETPAAETAAETAAAEMNAAETAAAPAAPAEESASGSADGAPAAFEYSEPAAPAPAAAPEAAENAQQGFAYGAPAAPAVAVSADSASVSAGAAAAAVPAGTAAVHCSDGSTRTRSDCQHSEIFLVQNSVCDPLCGLYSQHYHVLCAPQCKLQALCALVYDNVLYRHRTCSCRADNCNSRRRGALRYFPRCSRYFIYVLTKQKKRPRSGLFFVLSNFARRSAGKNGCTRGFAPRTPAWGTERFSWGFAP